jgi:hypothetical protein
MNDITTALKTAGVQIPPLNKRVWLWLNDHPFKTSRDIALALKASHSQVATVLRTMERRKMVACQEAPARPVRGKGARKTVFTWHTLTRTFVLLPKPKKVEKAFVAPTPVAFTLAPNAVPGITPTAAPPKGFDMESCTLRELRALYVSLKELFE